MSLESGILRIKRVAFPVTAVALFVATADGCAALLHIQDWNDPRWILAGLLAAIADAALVSNLLDWQKKRRLSALLFAAIFMFVSGMASVNFWWRHIRGSEKTTEVFSLQQTVALQALLPLRDRLQEAAAGLSQLAAYSRDMSEREVKNGDTCGIHAKIPGPRQRFRTDDARFFAGLQNDIAAVPARLSAEIETVRTLRPVPEQTLEQDAGRLRHAMTNAYSVTRDPALGRIADTLRKRVADDNLDRLEGKTRFNCADASIRSQAGNVIARLDAVLNARLPEISVPNFTSATDGLRVLGLIFDYSSWGKPGGLSVTDAGIIFIALIIELALYSSSRGFARQVATDRRLRDLPLELNFIPDAALGFVRALMEEPDPHVRDFCAGLARYTARIGLQDRLIVAHGCSDPRAVALAWRAPALAAIDGWLERDRLVLGFLINMIGWWKWPETRGCSRRETFKVNRETLDELHLAEIVSRMRAKDVPFSPQPQDNWPGYQQAAE